MVRYPYKLEKWVEEEGVQNPDGSWAEGSGSWVFAGKCNARHNGNAQTVKGYNGEVVVYSYEVVMPSTTAYIPKGTPVRIYDKHNRNFFDKSAHSDDAPINGDTGVMYVEDFYESGQRNEDARLWL